MSIYIKRAAGNCFNRKTDVKNAGRNERSRDTAFCALDSFVSRVDYPLYVRVKVRFAFHLDTAVQRIDRYCLFSVIINQTAGEDDFSFVVG